MKSAALLGVCHALTDYWIAARHGTRIGDPSVTGNIHDYLAPMFESGALKPSAISEQYPLSQAAQAYGRVASGKGGKVVLIMSSAKDAVGELATARGNDNT